MAKIGKDRAGAAPPRFEPYADDASVRTLGSLSLENGRACVALHGSLDLTRDRAGLERARRLRDTLDAVVRALEAAEAAGDLPDAVPDADEAPRAVPNPFA